jgi:hypothetical protein
MRKHECFGYDGRGAINPGADTSWLIYQSPGHPTLDGFCQWDWRFRKIITERKTGKVGLIAWDRRKNLRGLRNKWWPSFGLKGYNRRRAYQGVVNQIIDWDFGWIYLGEESKKHFALYY